MLLNIKLTLEVTNDGKNNNLVSVSVDPDYKFSEVLTALKMAQIDITKCFRQNMDATSLSDEEIDFMLNNITMGQLYKSQINEKS